MRPEEPEKLSDAEKLPQTASEGKKPPSIYSLSKWKEMSSEGGGTGATQSLAKDDLDWKTLTDYTLGANSQRMSQLTCLGSCCVHLVLFALYIHEI